MTYYNTPTKYRYQRLDAWRGYRIPRLAIVGASDTGDYADSPAPTEAVKAELRRFQKEVLRPLGIKSQTQLGESSNVFCLKRWIMVPVGSFGIAAAAAAAWIKENRYNTSYIHDANLDELKAENNFAPA